MVQERRFEQLVECVLGGMDVPQLLLQTTATPPLLSKPNRNDASDHAAATTTANGEEDTLHPNDPLESSHNHNGVSAVAVGHSGGLSVRDASRAAWGLAILGAHRLEQLGGQSMTDLLVALSLQAREQLLMHVQELRRDDLSSQTSHVDARISELSQQLAKDAAAAVWAFACVRACTGLRFAPLLEVCCTVLCQNPRELRRQAQEMEKDPGAFSVGSSDVVDRLARAEEEGNGPQGTDDADGGAVADVNDETYSRDAVVDALSPNEVTDVLWALALHGSRAHAESPSEDIALSETASTVQEILCDRLVGWLRSELAAIRTRKEVTPSFKTAGVGIEVHAVDAASILRSEVASYELQREGSDTHNGVRETEDFLSDENLETSILKIGPMDLTIGTAQSGETQTASWILNTFQPRDLCSMVWAVTELQDDLQSTITKLVVSIFLELGEETLQVLEGKDLSNLAWAVAKAPRLANATDESESALDIMAWIANTVVPPEVNAPSLINNLQPPELGRLVWALATSFLSSNSLTNPEGMQRLALAALQSTVDGFSGFAAEDLVSPINTTVFTATL